MSRFGYLDEEQVRAQCERRRVTIAVVREEHPEAVVIACADEKSGARFGRAAVRRGMAIKIGYTTYDHQIWVSWSPHDVAKNPHVQS